jgi:hypothetical protein
MGLGMGEADWVRPISSRSINTFLSGLTTVANLPKLIGTVPDFLKTGDSFKNPVKTYGIAVMLQYRSTETNSNPFPRALTTTVALSATLGHGKERR